MIELNDVIIYLEQNLSIEIEQNQEFGPVEQVTVKLYLGNTQISSDSCDLPNNG